MKPYRGRLWSVRGERTAIPQRSGYKNFYISAAVVPATGAVYQERQDRMGTEVFQGFLDRLASAWASFDVLLVLDQAGWHRAKRLVWPENICPVYLPPYSPELNPAEKLWLLSKAKTLKNKLFDSIEQQIEIVGGWFQELTPASVQRLCSCHYLV